MSIVDSSMEAGRLPNGPGGAAVLSAGVGAFVLSALAILGDHSAAFKKLMIFYRPTGPLSGVTSISILVWLGMWLALDLLWRRKDSKDWAITAGLILMAVAFVLMIPSVADAMFL